MNKRQMKKKLNKGLRRMSNEQLINLHVNHQGDKYWPIVDIEVRKRFDYRVDLINLKVVQSEKDNKFKLVQL